MVGSSKMSVGLHSQSKEGTRELEKTGESNTGLEVKSGEDPVDDPENDPTRQTDFTALFED